MDKLVKILNCEPSWQFLCPQTWDNLEKTDNSEVRNCSECKKDVHRAFQMSEVIELTRQGKCVAFAQLVDSEQSYIIGEGPDGESYLTKSNSD